MKNYADENLKTLNMLLEKFPLKQKEEDYLRTKIDLYWTPSDFRRYFQMKFKNARYIKT